MAACWLKPSGSHPPAQRGKGSLNEALGTLRGMKDAAAQMLVLDARLKEVECADREAEVEALVEKGLEDGKLAPGITTWAEKYGLADLAGFTAYLASALPVRLFSAEGPRAVSAIGAGQPGGGLTWETLRPIEKHRLFHEDRPTYDALKHDYEKRTGQRLGGE